MELVCAASVSGCRAWTSGSRCLSLMLHAVMRLGGPRAAAMVWPSPLAEGPHTEGNDMPTTLKGQTPPSSKARTEAREAEAARKAADVVSSWQWRKTYANVDDFAHGLSLNAGVAMLTEQGAPEAVIAVFRANRIANRAARKAAEAV